MRCRSGAHFTHGKSRSARFLVTRGQGPDGPEIIVSVFGPAGGTVELMAWDVTQGGFNYYRTIAGGEGDEGAWVWAGNSRHAFDPDMRARGPFESHPTGNLLMKELKVPWQNWDSPKAPVDEQDFRAGDSRATHEWFTPHHGAYTLEDSVAKPAIARWNRRRLERIVEAGVIEDPIPLMEQLLGSPDPTRHTVNLVSSEDSSLSAVSAERVRLPTTFFVDFDGLEILKLKGPEAPFSTPGAHYGQALGDFGAVVKNEAPGRPRGDGEDEFERRGDTHFAFFVPERAFEDVNFLKQLVAPETGPPLLDLVSPRLAACLLMVDFPNPVFSEARAGLISHVSPGPLAKEQWSGFSEELGDKIAAAAGEEDTAEAQFKVLWDQGEDGWQDAANRLLDQYYKGVSETVETAEGFANYFKLAEARRDRVRAMRIDETPLLFAQTNLEAEELGKLMMGRDGKVVSQVS